MEINNRPQLKQYFESGKRPTQSNFGDLIDSIVLKSEIPPIETKSYKLVSFLLRCNGRRPGKPKIGFSILENSLTDLSIGIELNRISIRSTDINYEFNLDKIFINIGTLNDTCGFDKVTFSLNESTSTELVLYCEITNTSSEEPVPPGIPGSSILGDPIIIDPGAELPETISFQQLAIEIRIYDELLNLIENDPNLSRYRTYISTKDLRRENNLLIPPYRFVSPDGRRNNKYNGSNTDPDLAVWKQMPDKYLVLPEINTDQEKNPHVYNLKTNNFGCYYSYLKDWINNGDSSDNFLQNSVKKARRAGAVECIVNLGDRNIKGSITKLQEVFFYGSSAGIERITLIVNNVITHYTREEILAL